MRRLVVILCVCAIVMKTTAQRIVINEVQVANVDMFIDPSFNYGGWVELYNTTADTLYLTNCTLWHTDAEETSSHEKLTALHGMLPPHGFCNLWFDHNYKNGYYGLGSKQQIPFKLDMDGGVIELRDAVGDVLDAVAYPPAVPRCSFARMTDGGNVWGTTSTPTPRQSNEGSLFSDERLAMPQVDVKGGVFSEPFSFRVDIPAGTTLYYSTGGATPVPGRSPVSTDGRFDVDSTIIYRFMLTKEDCLNSPVATRSFIKATHDYYLPVVSVTTHPLNLYGDSIGLYVGGVNGRIDNHQTKKMNQNMDWERPVNVEYFVPDEEGRWQEVLNQGATFSIFGGWTRFNDGDSFFQFKPSFKLKAEKMYEWQTFFSYPVFSAKPYIKNKTLLVRNGGQDQHARLKDAAIQELIHSSGIYLDCQATQPAHIFLDGQYLGMMNLREASNRNYAYSNYGIGSDEVDQWENEFDVKAGTKDIYNRWYTLSRQVAASPTNQSLWQSLCDIVDVDEYCNYMAAEIYMGNLDWLRGGLKNIKGFRCRKDDGKIHVVLFDLDGGFGDTDMIVQLFNKGVGRQVEIFKNMLQYKPFLQQFIDAYCMMGGSVFLPDRCLPIIRRMAATTHPALEWEGYGSQERAEALCDILADRENQHEKRIASLKKQFGLTGELKVDIEASTPQARLLLNGCEIPTGRFSGTLFGTTELTAITPAGYEFEGWQVDDETVSTDTILDLRSLKLDSCSSVVASFRSVPLRGTEKRHPIRINEVSSSNDIYISDYQKKSDWIELYNTTDSVIDLAGMYLSDNPEKMQKYQIPSGDNTLITPHGYRIVWCDNNEPLDQLHASFKLANADSAFVSIQAADGSWTDSLHYQAQRRWQTFGRYPDGADQVALFDRITIEQPNHILTHTQLVPVVTTDITSPYSYTQREAMKTKAGNVIVQYYSLSGQRLSGPTDASIVVRRIIYSDGTTESTKIRVKEF
ncbi:MAG: lamin tail domain-containing protein [Bacteroidaceae bacterium]|nr:lamin tail domain-containing protein [Bacteroidaceae bacterium]